MATETKASDIVVSAEPKKEETNVLYYSLLLDEKSHQIIMENKDILETKLITNESGSTDKKWNFDFREKKVAFHVTMLYVGGKALTDPEDIAIEKLVTLMVGQTITVKINSLVWNDKASALAVERTFPCKNVYPHITVLLSKGIMPVYSNELAKLASENQANSKPIDLELTGVVHVVTKKK